MSRRSKSRGGLAPDKYLSKDQAQKLLHYIRSQARLARTRGSRREVINEMIIELLLYTGLRAAELCDLKMRDLPLHHGKDVIFVRDGKGEISRTVEIPVSLTAKLKRFIQECCKGAKPKSPVIPSEAGYRLIYWKTYSKRKYRKPGESKYIIEQHQEHSARLTYRCLYSKVKMIGRKAGIGWLTPHMLRHTYLTLLYNIKNDLRFVQDQAGHANIDTTQIYTATSNEERRRQVEAIKL